MTFHYEAVKDIEEVINLIKNYGIKVGIAINPKTDINVLIPYLNMIDVILVMSVEPGFGGQSFMESSIDKVKELKELKDKNNYNYLINIDGGIKDTTAKFISKYVDLAVAGSYICNAENPKKNMEILQKFQNSDE